MVLYIILLFPSHANDLIYKFKIVLSIYYKKRVILFSMIENKIYLGILNIVLFKYMIILGSPSDKYYDNE